MKKNPRFLIMLFFIPVLLALFYVLYFHESRKELTEKYVRSGLIALYRGGEVSREDLREYFKKPPPVESPILRGLEITPEDVAGLEHEDPSWFQEEQGQLLLSRVIRHIALLEYLQSLNDASIQDELREQTQNYRDSLLLYRIEEELDRTKPAVKHEEMVAYYVEHPEQFHRDAKRYARHLMLYNPVNSEEITQASPQAVLDRLKVGEDFQNLIAESESISRENGGILGWIEPGTVASPFEQTLWSLKIGEITGPIEVGHTLHFVQLLDEQREELIPLREAIPQLREILQKRKQNMHRYEMLNLSQEVLNSPDPMQTQEYRQALLRAALERKMDQEPEISQQVEIYKKYRKADLQFIDYIDRTTDSDSTSNLWQIENDAIHQLLEEINFRLLVKLRTFKEDSEVGYE